MDEGAGEGGAGWCRRLNIQQATVPLMVHQLPATRAPCVGNTARIQPGPAQGPRRCCCSCYCRRPADATAAAALPPSLPTPDTHVAHHLFSYMPHYHAEEATEAIKKVRGSAVCRVCVRVYADRPPFT